MSTITVLSILHNLVTDATCIMLPDNGVEAYMLYGISIVLTGGDTTARGLPQRRTTRPETSGRTDGDKQG